MKGRGGAAPEGGSVEAMIMLLGAAEAELEALRAQEPEDEESEAHEEWENDMDDLMDEIDDLRDALSPD